MNRACIALALAGIVLSPAALRPQDAPAPAPSGAKTLAVRVNALVPGGGADRAAPPGWHEESVKYTLPGVPVGVRLVGTNIVIVTQVTPFAHDDGTVTLVAQGQVWLKVASGGISYRTTIETVTLELGGTVLFFPLGVDASGRAPLRVEISVSQRPPDPPASADEEPKTKR